MFGEQHAQLITAARTSGSVSISSIIACASRSFSLAFILTPPAHRFVGGSPMLERTTVLTEPTSSHAGPPRADPLLKLTRRNTGRFGMAGERGANCPQHYNPDQHDVTKME